ncbi:MAG: PilW family protein [Rhodoferax sp.]
MPRAQRGLSLVELLVALTLGLVAVGGAVSIYLANRQSFATVEAVARVEEGTRFALELLARDVREAGNSVCGGAMVSNNLITTPAVPNWASWDRGLLGNALSDTDVLATSIAGPTDTRQRDLNSDSLLVWSASTGDNPVRITTHVTGVTGTFTTATAHGYAAGDVVVACDGKQLLTFEVQSPGATSVAYGGGASVKPMLPNGLLHPLTTHLWYVGGSSDVAGAQALRRITIDKNGAAIANDEMITGVAKMQIRYLVGDTATGVPDPAATYQSASMVPVWSSVIAVQITLTLSSLEKINRAGSSPSVYLHTLPITVAVRRSLQP